MAWSVSLLRGERGIGGTGVLSRVLSTSASGVGVPYDRSGRCCPRPFRGARTGSASCTPQEACGPSGTLMEESLVPPTRHERTGAGAQ
jgi:hypothetical protein